MEELIYKCIQIVSEVEQTVGNEYPFLNKYVPVQSAEIMLVCVIILT